MRWLLDLSIRRKLTLAMLVTTLAVLSLACVALVSHELRTFRQSMAEDVTVLADVVGRNSTAALTLGGEKDALDTLSSLAADRHIIAACIYTKEGKLFAGYARAGSASDYPAQPPPNGPANFDHDRLTLSHAIMLGDERIGTIYLRADQERMNDRLKSYGVILVVVVVVAFVVTVGLSFGLQRLISHPILALARTARAVAERKDYSVRAPRQGRDEIGQLTDAVNGMLAEIEAGQAALQKANGALQAQAADVRRVNESLEAQASELQEANRSLEAQARQITDTAGVLGTSSGEILSLSTHVAASAAQTATAVAETTTTVAEVKQTALVSSQKTRQVSEGAQRVAKISQGGKKSTEQTIEGMNRIRGQMQSIADSMSRLSEQTLTIGNIIASVEDLAQQSNLLAVNAAIEAAKAGEHGKGFSVVAQEVKSLAEQSRQATTQVRTILGDIRKATGAAVMATEQGTKVVEAGVQRSEEAGESILSLASSVADAAQAAVQIAASSQQQLIGMDQVAEAMESIKQASVQNLNSATRLEEAARNLDGLGQQLKGLVGRYKIENGRAT